MRENGLFVLRSGSEDIADDFYMFYKGMTDDFQTKFQVIMILGIIFLFLSQFVLIPKVFEVHKMNNKVISLFGMIPPDEIRGLAIKCENFMQGYLEDRAEKRDFENENEE